MVLGRRGHATLRDVVWSSIDARASPAPARRPAPEVAPTASSASVAGSVGWASRVGELGQRLAADRAVEQRRGQQGRGGEVTSYGGGQHVVGPADGSARGEPARPARRRRAASGPARGRRGGRGGPARGGRRQGGRGRRARTSRRPVVRATPPHDVPRGERAGRPGGWSGPAGRRPPAGRRAPRRPGRGRRGRAGSTRVRRARGLAVADTRPRHRRRGRRTGRSCSRGRPAADHRTPHGADRARRSGAATGIGPEIIPQTLTARATLANVRTCRTKG